MALKKTTFQNDFFNYAEDFKDLFQKSKNCWDTKYEIHFSIYLCDFDNFSVKDEEYWRAYFVLIIL